MLKQYCEFLSVFILDSKIDIYHFFLRYVLQIVTYSVLSAHAAIVAY